MSSKLKPEPLRAFAEEPIKTKNSDNTTVHQCIHCGKNSYTDKQRCILHQQHCDKNPAEVVFKGVRGFHRSEDSKQFNCLLCPKNCTTESRIKSHVKTQHKASIMFDASFEYRVSQSGLNLIFMRELCNNYGVFANFEQLSQRVKLLEDNPNSLEKKLNSVIAMFDKNFVKRAEFAALSATVNRHTEEISGLTSRLDAIDKRAEEELNVQKEINESIFARLAVNDEPQPKGQMQNNRRWSTQEEPATGNQQPDSVGAPMGMGSDGRQLNNQMKNNRNWSTQEEPATENQQTDSVGAAMGASSDGRQQYGQMKSNRSLAAVNNVGARMDTDSDGQQLNGHMSNESSLSAREDSDKRLGECTKLLTFPISKRNVRLAKEHMEWQGHEPNYDLYYVAAQLGAFFTAQMISEKLQVKFDSDMFQAEKFQDNYLFKVLAVPNDYKRQKQISEKFSVSNCFCRIGYRNSRKSATVEIAIFGIDKSTQLSKYLRQFMSLNITKDFKSLARN